MFYNYPIFFEQNRVFRVYKGGKLFADFFSDDSEDGNYPEEWVVSSVHALNEGSTDKYEGISKISMMPLTNIKRKLSASVTTSAC